MDCNVFYRISSESYPKPKIPGTTKEICLENFIRIFGNKIVVVADNCHEPLLKHMENLRLKIFESNFGNSGSFRHALQMAVSLPPESLVYFVEDDYLHLQSAPQLLTEAIHYADYVTLYDHPDKYGPMYDGGEVSKVFRTTSSHWRFSQSTTMTFAAQVKTLRADFQEWMAGTENQHPDDHGTFTLLGEKKQRTLAVSVPGVACHTDLTYSTHVGHNTMEEWAVEQALGYLLWQLEPEASSVVDNMRRAGMTKLQQAACLEELLKKKKDK